jgi:hypothetical protein
MEERESTVTTSFFDNVFQGLLVILCEQLPARPPTASLTVPLIDFCIAMPTWFFFRLLEYNILAPRQRFITNNQNKFASAKSFKGVQKIQRFEHIFYLLPEPIRKSEPRDWCRTWASQALKSFVDVIIAFGIAHIATQDPQGIHQGVRNDRLLWVKRKLCQRAKNLQNLCSRFSGRK